MPVPISVIASSTVSRPSLSRRARAVALRSTSARIAEATPRPRSQRPSRTLAGFATRLSQPKRAAPWRNASARWREANGLFRSGSTSVSFRSRRSTGSSPRASASSSIAHSRASRPIASPGARIKSERGRSSFERRCRVSRLGCGIEHASCSADRFGVVVEARALHERVLP